MRLLLIILLILFFLDGSCQKDSAIWHVNDEKSISEYFVQKSKDRGTWQTIATVPKGKKSYYYVLPTQTTSTYYRVVAIGEDTLFSRGPVLLKMVDNNVTISSPLLKSSTLSWIVKDEVNVSYYLIQKSLDGVTWTQTSKVTDKGNRLYTYRLAYTTRKYQYRITPVYMDGTFGTTLIFTK